MSPKIPSISVLTQCNRFASSAISHNSVHTHKKNLIKTAGILVIGDEILKGHVHDTNSHHATKLLHRLGIKVKKVVIVGDDVDEIASEVKMFSSAYDYVLTTGGIGPTHDDVTFEGIARAFNVSLVADPTLVDICSRFYKTTDVTAPGMKLAYIPHTAQLRFGVDKTTGARTPYPNISIRNVFIFPGVPQLFRRLVDILGRDLFRSDKQFFTHNIYVNVGEQKCVEALDRAVRKYPNVAFGSYPDMNNDEYKVKLTVESTNEEMTRAAAIELQRSFKQTQIVRSESSTHS